MVCVVSVGESGVVERACVEVVWDGGTRQFVGVWGGGTDCVWEQCGLVIGVVCVR
jgi:hypothetical protein